MLPKVAWRERTVKPSKVCSMETTSQFRQGTSSTSTPGLQVQVHACTDTRVWYGHWCGCYGEPNPSIRAAISFVAWWGASGPHIVHIRGTISQARTVMYCVSKTEGLCTAAANTSKPLGRYSRTRGDGTPSPYLSPFSSRGCHWR